MTRNEMTSLQAGDVVRGNAAGLGYVVTGNYGDHVTAVRTVTITNPAEWEFVSIVEGLDQSEAIRQVDEMARRKTTVNMAGHTALLTECEKAIQMVRNTVPMNGRSEGVWESLHGRVRDALGMPKLEVVSEAS